jgi:cobalamin biosynthesis protein CobW
VRQELRAGVRMVRAGHAAVPSDILVGLGAAAESDLDSRPSHHDDGSDHEHDDFTSFHVDLPTLDDPQAFVDRLRGVIAGHAILRVKGFAVVAGKPMRLVLQGVGDRVQHYFDRAWRSDEARIGRLVVIGERALDQGAVEGALLG